jgi:hypothetical protein
MLAGRQKTVGAAGIDADAAIDILGAPVFRRAVPLQRHDVEIHLGAAVIRIQRIKRESRKMPRLMFWPSARAVMVSVTVSLPSVATSMTEW